MMNLIQNELIKIFKRKNTYILLLIVITLIASYNVFEKITNISQDISIQYERAYKNDKMLLENYDNLNVKETYEEIVERMSLEEYAIHNNIKYNIIYKEANKNVPIPLDARYLLMHFMDKYEIIIICFIVYFSATILSEEYTSGTIKSLLTKPYKRTKILLSKIISLFIAVMLLLSTLIFFQVIFNGILFGFDSYSLEAIRYNVLTHNIETMNLIKYMFLLLLCKMPMYLLIMFEGILFGVITNNMALNILISVGLYILSTMSILINTISKFIYIFNWDISKYWFGNGNIMFSLIISVISLLIIFIISCFIFHNKDVKNE